MVPMVRVLPHPRITPPDRDLFYHVGWGLRTNIQSASAYVLLAAIKIPQLRHWWIIVSALYWLLTLASEEYNAFTKATNEWATLEDQIKYLSETAPGAQRSLFERT